MTVDVTEFRDIYPFEPHYLDIEGHRYHYVDEGSGETIVMLHGNPTWSFYYRRLIQAFKDSHRVLAPDHMGCGLSDKPQDFDYTMAAHARNVARLFTELDLKDVTLVVHDWGGPIGFHFALEHKERIKRIVVFNSAAFPVPAEATFPWRIRICRIPLFGDLSIRGLNLFAKMALRWASARPEALTPQVRAGYLTPYDSWANRVALLRFVQDIPLGPEDVTWNQVARMENSLSELAHIPMLIVWGELDFCFTLPILDRWQECFPEARVERITDAGHYVVEDAPDKIIPMMKQFVEDHPLA